MNSEVQEILKDIIGKPCCRKMVGEWRSLSLGFGEIVPYKPDMKRISKISYGEWELGTFYDSWRILKAGRILCGSKDAVDTIAELNAAVNRIEIGRCSALRQLTDMDVRVECDNGVTIDFLATVSGGEESFHIFCPKNQYIEFTVKSGWQVGPSDKPWNSIDNTESTA
jgi:hypothetical protein